MNKVEERYYFSERTEKLRLDILARSDDDAIRNGKFTRKDDDGKTPFEDVFERYPDDPYIINLARGIVESWMVTEPIVFDRDILVGFPRPDRCIHEHFSWGITCDCEPEERSERVKKLADRLFPLDAEHMDSEGRRILGAAEYDTARFGGLWWTGGYQGHTVPSYEKLMTMGVGGVVDQIDRYDALTPAEDAKKKNFYEACRIVMKGFSEWIKMHADYTASMAEKSDDPTAKRELKAISENCRRIAWDAPTDMYGAAQLTWFYSLWDFVDCLGRTDRYLIRFYKGHEDDDIVAALIMKFWEQGVHCLTVGGVDSNGEDSTNDLSYLILQILRTMHEIHPRMAVRIHEKTPADLLSLVVTMWSEGMSDPTVVSDKTVIEGLEALGAKPEDARDYTALGCQEIEIPGKSNFGCEDGSINLAKILEYTLNHGRDRFSGVKVGLDLGGITDYKTFDELWNAFEKQIKYLTEPFIYLCNRGVDIRVANVAKLVKSPLTEACIERGLQLDEGGSIYNYGVIETAGHGAAADALYAMKTLVYEQGKISLEDLDAAISANYEGYEEIRRMLLGAPKFGNNDDGADEMACRVLGTFWDEIGKYKSVRGDSFTGACSLLEGGIVYGSQTWALPDGRHTGDPLGNTIGPRTGSDKNGLTAMLSSVAKLPLRKGVGGSSCNVMIPTTMMETEEQKENICALIKTFMMMGGQLAQITTATLEEMQAAQIHPEDHEDLIVRVGGFSAKFVCLGKETQDEIIARLSA